MSCNCKKNNNISNEKVVSKEVKIEEKQVKSIEEILNVDINKINTDSNKGIVSSK